MPNTKFIAYYRVSTQKQGRSGLGLDAQKKAVEDHIRSTQGRLLGEFKEVESGKHNDRPELTKALHRAKVTGSVLLVAKLDRLSRNAAFLLTLRDSGVEFVAADMPDVSSLTVGVMALIAQHEREAISSRTKAALAAAKDRGVKLGNPMGAAAFGDGGNDAAVARIRANADRFARENVAPIVADIRAGGIHSLAGIAEALNAREIQAPRGGRWYATSVRNLLQRLEVASD